MKLKLFYGTKLNQQKKRRKKERNICMQYVLNYLGDIFLKEFDFKQPLTPML